MSLESKIFDRLSGDAGITALVATRIYPNIKPENAIMPAIVFHRISSIRYPAMRADSNVMKARFQFDIFADTYDAANAIRIAMIPVVNRWRDMITPPNLFDTFIVNELDLYEAERKQSHIAVDVELQYYEN